MKPYVSIAGVDINTTIIETNSPNQHVIIGSHNSSLSNLTLEGATGNGYCGIYLSSSASTIYENMYVFNIKFGNNDTLVHAYGDTSPSYILLRHITYGGNKKFNNGFVADNNNNTTPSKVSVYTCSPVGTMNMSNPVQMLISNGVGTEIVANSFSTRFATINSGSTGILVKNGGIARISSINLKGFSRAFASDNVGFPPTLYCSGAIIENCLMEVDMKHTSTMGYFNGYVDYSKIYISDSSSFFITNKNLNIIGVGAKGCDFIKISDALNSITNNSSDNIFIIKLGPGTYVESELIMKPYVNIIGESITSVVIQPDGPHNIISFTGNVSDISFLTLSGAQSGYNALYVNDAGNFNMAHKISFYDCDTNIRIESKTKDTYFYGEYIDFNNVYTNGIVCQDINNLYLGNTCTLNLGDNSQLYNVIIYGTTPTSVILQSGFKISNKFSTINEQTTWPKSIISSSSGVQRNLVLMQGATQDLGLLNPTDINSSGGQTIWNFRGILTNATNWKVLSAPATITTVF